MCCGAAEQTGGEEKAERDGMGRCYGGSPAAAKLNGPPKRRRSGRQRLRAQKHPEHKTTFLFCFFSRGRPQKPRLERLARVFRTPYEEKKKEDETVETEAFSDTCQVFCCSPLKEEKPDADSGLRPADLHSNKKPQEETADRRICYDTTSPEHFDDFLVYSTVVSAVMFVLPFMVVMVCNGLMVRRLLKSSWGSKGDRGTLAAQQSKQKSVKMIIIVLAAFMLCFLPFHFTRSLYYFFRYIRNVNPAQISCKLLEVSSVAYKVTRPLASANSCVDPILYFLAGQDVWSNFKKKSKLSRSKSVSVS
ncbi:hypothetical protein Q5P01_010133 [Channa striata]|uniref:P2Y purinoceptor 2 n=1 Tax=Channa striata TaxID=64152 RepID=A0AA88SRH5_CHASR|nr:hypothetical protein Q5P01_010133 [Channa striata]